MTYSPSTRISRGLLWLFILDLGIAFGAGLYESRIVFPQWLVWSEAGWIWNAEAARTADVGLRFWVGVTSLPLTLLLIANAVLAFRSRGPARRYWLMAVGLCAVERAMTIGFFIPTMIALTEPGVVTAPELVAKAMLWEKLNFLRHLLSLATWAAAMKTLATLYRSQAAH